jgi:acetyltransferase-like isoleucine patch superfamily enzyme
MRKFMNKIFAPQESANDDVLNVLYVIKNLSEVKRGDLLFELEASKTVIDIRSEYDGLFYSKAMIGEKVSVGSLIGIVSETTSITEADLLIALDGDDGQKIKKDSKAEQFSGLRRKLPESNLMVSKYKPEGKVAVLGGGMGLSQIMEIFKKSLNFEYVGVYDDILWNGGVPRKRYSTPVLGPVDMDVINQDFIDGLFDSLVISVSTSIEFREKWMKNILSHNINFPNLIHPSVQIAKTAVMGVGNVILPNVHIGPHAQIGSNNFISAFSNIEHHCYLGNSNTFGPGVIMSASVEIGNGCKFGTGIFIEPKLQIRDGAVIASGQSISNHIAANMVAKKRS